MKPSRFVLAAAFCIVLGLAALGWGVSLVDSLYAYRSPLHSRPPLPGEVLGEPLSRRVVFFLIDGLREDTSRDLQAMPFLNELRGRAAWAVMHSRPPSYSAPGYSTLLTGAWPELNDGPVFNASYEDIPLFTQDDLFSAARRAGLRTALSGYYWFEKLVPQQAMDSAFYTPAEDQHADQAVMEAALPWLEQGGYDFILIHLDQLDFAGHYEGGPEDPRWQAAARRIDDHLRQAAARLDLEQDILLIASDHGHIQRGGHGGHDLAALREPFLLLGPGITPGRYADIEMVDVAPTLAVLLGTNLPASSQGRVLVEMLGGLSAADQARVKAAYQAQQSRLRLAHGQALGLPSQESGLFPAGGSTEPLLTDQAVMEAAFQRRLASERLPRFAAALAAALAFLAVLLYVFRRSGMTWLVGGGLLFSFCFNLRFGVIGGRTYSWSSVAGVEDILLFVGVSALAALFTSSVFFALFTRLLRRPPAETAWMIFGMGFFALYFVSLPVGWSFALNGPLVGWALPEWRSHFLAFLSLVQMGFLGLYLPLFAGGYALLARLASRR